MSPDWADEPTAIPNGDPENPQSINLYAYVENNPLIHTDPDGHACETKPTWVTTFAGETTYTGYTTTCTGLNAMETNLYEAFAHKYNPLVPVGNFIARNRDTWWMQTLSGGGCTHSDHPEGCIQAGVMPWGTTAGLSGTVPGLMRVKLLSQVTDGKLRNIISDLYKATSSLGDGGTADAVLYERATGMTVGGTFHSSKAMQYSTALQSAISSGRLSAQESGVAQFVLDQLTHALTYAGR
jgi:hypothetical protein